MRTRPEMSYIAEVKVQRDQKPALGYNPLPYEPVAGAGEPLIVNAVGLVAVFSEAERRGLDSGSHPV